jgi:hypothetical protein
MDLRLLKHATEKSPAEPMAQVALAYRGLDLLANGVGDQQTTLTVTSNAIAAIRAIEPTNSVPLYLQGALDCLLTNVSAAKGLIVEAARTEGFNTYAVPLKLSIVHALESVGYSPYTARIVASGYASGVVAWSKLNKAVLGAEPSAEELRACHVLGARVAGGKSFLEQLVGDSIQTRSAGKMGGAEFAGEPQRIAEQKGRIKRATAYLDSARTRHVSESRWVEYYDRCFGVGELEAIEALAKANGDTF